jgi:hypothetical protein
MPGNAVVPDSWRGLFLIGLVPALMTLMIRTWVPEIAALADPPRTDARMRAGQSPGHCRSIQMKLICLRPPPDAAYTLARTVQTSAQRGPRLPDWAVADEQRRTGLVGANLVAAVAQDHSGRSLLSDDLGRRFRLRRSRCSVLPDLIGRRPSGMLTCLGGSYTIIAPYKAEV